MAKVVNCPCGEVLRAETDYELVSLVLEHGKAVHHQEVTARTRWRWPSRLTDPFWVLSTVRPRELTGFCFRTSVAQRYGWPENIHSCVQDAALVVNFDGRWS